MGEQYPTRHQELQAKLNDLARVLWKAPRFQVIASQTSTVWEIVYGLAGAEKKKKINSEDAKPLFDDPAALRALAEELW